MIPTIVAIFPGKHFAEITNDEVTNAASPRASAHLIAKLIQKNIGPGGRRFKNPKATAVIPVKKIPKENILLAPNR